MNKLTPAEATLIRQMVLNGCSYRIRDLLLNIEQVDLLNITKEPTTTKELANELGISIQNASQKLRRLYNAGYVRRLEVIQESGRIEYVYENVYEIN